MNSQLTIYQMGAMIGEALKSDGVTQAEFARIVGVSEKHLSQAITGAAAARLIELDYWAFALGRHWSVTLDKQASVS